MRAAEAVDQIELGSVSEAEEVTIVEMIDPIRFYAHAASAPKQLELVGDRLAQMNKGSADAAWRPKIGDIIAAKFSQVRFSAFIRGHAFVRTHTHTHAYIHTWISNRRQSSLQRPFRLVFSLSSAYTATERRAALLHSIPVVLSFPRYRASCRAFLSITGSSRLALCTWYKLNSTGGDVWSCPRPPDERYRLLLPLTFDQPNTKHHAVLPSHLLSYPPIGCHFGHFNPAITWCCFSTWGCPVSRSTVPCLLTCNTSLSPTGWFMVQGTGGE